jgi:multidrug efflux pump subunit AcrB
LTPVLAALWLKVGNARAPGPLWQRFVVGYRRVLHWALAHPRAVLAGAVISLLAGVALIPLIPQGFIPALDRGECDIRYALPPGSGLAASDQMAQQLTRLAARDPDVAHILAIAELEAGATDRGVLRVTLRPDRRGTTRLIEARLRRALVSVRGAVIRVDDIPIIAVAAQQPLAVTLTGKDVRALTGAARSAIGRIRTWQGVADVSLAGLGPDGDGTWLRRNGIPAAVIRGNLGAGTDLGTMTKRLQTELARVLPSGVQLQLEGESAQAAEVFAQFAPALGFAVVGVLAVLLFLFRSAQDPVAIAAALPLSVVGALLGLYVARSDFGIVSLLGLVFLIGLINKNAIILVDRINQLRTGGMAIEAAVLEAGPVRLRPIVMTTAAAVLGMVPIALGFGAGAELRAPMAVAIIGGLLTSTLLSLIVVPVIYCWLDRQFPRFRD